MPESAAEIYTTWACRMAEHAMCGGHGSKLLLMPLGYRLERIDVDLPCRCICHSSLTAAAERLRQDLEHVRREDLTDEDRAALRKLLEGARSALGRDSEPFLWRCRCGQLHPADVGSCGQT